MCIHYIVCVKHNVYYISILIIFMPDNPALYKYRTVGHGTNMVLRLSTSMVLYMFITYPYI